MPREKGDRRAYWELLRDPQWQRKRLEVMERAEFRCETCEATDKTLNVHHRLYRKNALPWEYFDHELVCLCEDCHEQEHHTRGLIDEALAMLGPMYFDDVLGYLRGMVFENNAAGCVSLDDVVKIRSPEYVMGLNASMRLDLDYTMEPLVSAAAVTVRDLVDMAAAARKARIARLDEKLKSN